VDLVLTDLMMPDGVSGEELATQLREQKPGIPVVFTSGYCANTSAGSSRLVEGQNFIPKPSSSELMLRTIRFSLSPR
jgi:CheY-like chemotaxis protein